ncbi:MAG: YggS family pyridoxal phosphate-dependent enzyme [Bacteroidetes bacterium]|nr:YggS family pyridoxal phosphate-dependent enzyme [Bacteroidota bacterium]MBK9670992.1 YggS family pyridoxal phosphate-dependent enzyme [Bacteroidota bacterium]MBK9798304.1 YggS family pyridoxal phosphate-dependent enzyme [Bacteroidota bacterium]MBP6413951.1 YggS family pyridoxal phosphate-dependent enzyme [Bacteroidia bacterium]
MSIQENLHKIKASLPANVTLIAVTKTHPVEKLMEVYSAGHKIFGENKVQELCDKQEVLPKDIEWHLIGHLQSNKVKYIAPFVALIHSVDSFKLLAEIDKQAKKNNRIIDCLLQIFIASEETKFGLDFKEAEQLLSGTEIQALQNIRIVGLMGMASNTSDTAQVKKEFHSLKTFFESQKNQKSSNVQLSLLSMGMSSDYELAIEEGSNMVRVGSAIFGAR